VSSHAGPSSAAIVVGPDALASDSRHDLPPWSPTPASVTSRTFLDLAPAA
jgi:hypothetical protein